MHRLGSQDPYMGTNLPFESFFFLNLISVMLFGMNFCSASGILQDDQNCHHSRGIKIYEGVCRRSCATNLVLL